jgi:hypothetical protein
MARTPLPILCALALSACAPMLDVAVDLGCANARAVFQTDPAKVRLLAEPPTSPYDVLGDIEVTAMQRGSFGDPPDREEILAKLRERAALLGADAVIGVRFGEQGMTWRSMNELRGAGRAIRFR